MIVSLVLAVAAVSFLPNLTIFGGTVNLAIIIITRELYRTSAKNRNLWLTLAIFFGLGIDLLSGSIFLSATISLLLTALIGRAVKRLVPLEEQIYLAVPAIFGLTAVYDLLFLLLNRSFAAGISTFVPVAFDATLSALGFVIINIVVDRFRGLRHQSERMKVALSSK